MLGLLKGAWNQTKDLGKTFMHGQQFSKAETDAMLFRMDKVSGDNGVVSAKTMRERELNNNLAMTAAGFRSASPIKDAIARKDQQHNIATLRDAQGNFRGDAGISGIRNRWSGDNSAMGQDLRSIGLLAATGVVGYQATAGALNLMRGDY